MPESRRRKPKNTGPTPPSKTASATRADAPSPTWYVVLMAALMGLGVLLVLARFVFEQDQWVMLVGLGMIAAGFLMTTNYK